MQQTLELKNNGDYDQVWCVFDRDSFPPARFNSALELARRNGIAIAYSNQAFELWYLLHYDYCDTATLRSDYETRLTERLGHRYEKNSIAIYDELRGRQAVAIRNAKNLLKQYSPRNPERDDPSTTVFLLVEELNKFIR